LVEKEEENFMVASLYSVEETKNTIWVYLEQESGDFEGVSLELLAKGRQMADQMGWPLVGLLLGHQVSDLVTSAFAHGVDQVCLADFPLLETFTIDAYAHVVHQALIDAKPNIFLLGATPNGRDLAGRLAVRLRTGLNADCTGLYINPENGVLVSEGWRTGADRDAKPSASNGDRATRRILCWGT
jgi:electron transfer flavoprotein alpha subunit